MRVKKSKPCGGRSPYQDWIEKQGFLLSPGEFLDEDNPELLNAKHLKMRIAQGNPDILDEKDEMFPSSLPSELLEATLEVLDDGGEKVLTPPQRKAFQLVVREGWSLRVAAKMMGIRTNGLIKHLKAGSKKIRALVASKGIVYVDGREYKKV
jgi:hypothetical protein